MSAPTCPNTAASGNSVASGLHRWLAEKHCVLFGDDAMATMLHLEHCKNAATTELCNLHDGKIPKIVNGFVEDDVSAGNSEKKIRRSVPN